MARRERHVLYPRASAFVLGVAWQTGSGRLWIFPWTLSFHFSMVMWCVVIGGGILLAIVVPSMRVNIIVLILVSFFLGVSRVDVSPIPKLRRIGDQLTVVRDASSGGDVSFLTSWREMVTTRIDQQLPADESALVVGILYGDGTLSKEQKNVFRSAGLMHIVAVSGSNVTIVVQCVTLLILGLGLRRRQTFWVTTLALIGFVGFVGFSSSVVRAALMSWLVLLAREVGRVASPFRLLLVAAVILLLVNPWSLLYDAGFALSFLAMWGILAWTPIFERWLSWVPKRFEMRTTLSMTLAATLMTAPYTAWMFQNLPLAGLAINVVALPLVPFIMGWGALLTLWSSWPGVEFFRTIVFGLVRSLEWVAGLSELVPWMQIPMKGLTLSVVACAYAVIIYLWFSVRRKGKLFH